MLLDSKYALTVLARLAKRSPKQQNKLMLALDGRLEHIAVDAVQVAIENGGPIGSVMTELVQKISQSDAQSKLIFHLDELLPLYSIHLRSLSVVVAKHMVSYFLSQEDAYESLDRLATAWANLGIRLSKTGETQEGLTAQLNGIKIRRQLAQDTDQQRSQLASELNNLAARYSSAGELSLSLQMANESVSIYRDLYASKPKQYRHDYSRVLATLANRLDASGNPKAGLTTSKLSLEIRRQMYQQAPGASRLDLAVALNGLSNRHYALGQRQEALAAATEALEHYRTLEELNADAYRPDLAMCLNNYSAQLAGMGQRAEALTAAKEAVVIRREQEQIRPKEFIASLARALNQLMTRAESCGDSDTALTAGNEAIQLFRQLVMDSPENHNFEFATCAQNLANVLNTKKEHHEALNLANESVNIMRHLHAKADRTNSNIQRAFITSLANLSGKSRRIGDFMEAEEQACEAVSLARLHFRDNANIARPTLISSLLSQAYALSEQDRYEDAKPLCTEAVVLAYDLYNENPLGFFPKLARALHNLAQCEQHLGHEIEAEAHTREWGDIYTQLKSKISTAEDTALRATLGPLMKILESNVVTPH